MTKFKSAFSALALTLMLLAGGGAGPALAADEIVTARIPGSYQQVVDRFKTGITRGGMMVLATVDHGKVLSMTGLSLKSQLFLVGNPNVGKQLFTQDRGAGLLVPLRVVIYEGDDGQTYLSYEKPSASLARLHNPGLTRAGSMLDDKMNEIGQMLMR